MRPIECEFEADVLAAVLQSRWPDRAEAPLREHAALCPICRDVALVAAAIDGAREEDRPRVAVPDAGRVWWVAQMRARREAVRAAGRPITAVQVAALACAMGIVGACFGATSAWFQSALRRLGTAAEARLPLLASAASAIAAHGVLAIALVTLLLLLPAALCLAVWRD